MSQPHVIEINVPFPEAEDLQLRFSVGACRLRLTPGQAEPWLAGTYRDPTGNLPCQIVQEGATVRIAQQPDIAGLFGILEGVPSFDLALGKARPYSLVIEGGASENTLDLGGLPIKRLALKHGAGRMDVTFSAPNPETMTLLEVGTGAGALELRNLANAGFAELRLDGGAASYRLDFGGSLRQNAHARISTGVSAVDLLVPRTTAAKVTVESVLGSIDVGDDWTRREGAFWTPAALAGATPVLTIAATVALGTLRLRIT